MSANRKLLGEIQQVLKKVEEGVQIFDEIWEKVYSAEQQALKEKYEADLKKEIKKLQRLRDQIKTWIGTNEIKDKTQLMESRKIIETKMEQFKVCEKDTKTKAYSKEGLAREAKLDPKEALKEEKRAWLNDCLDKLNDLIDSVEAEREKLLGSTKGKSKNKEALERFDNRVQKHKWHMAKLELIIKLLDNDDLEPSLVSGIKDSLDYYIESAVDDDGALGVEHEFDIYEDLELDRVTAPSFDLSPRAGQAKEEDSPGSAAAPEPAEAPAAVVEPEVVNSQTTPTAVPAKKGPVVASVPVAAAAKNAKADPVTKPSAATPAAVAAKISPKVTPAAAGKAAPTAAAKVSMKPAPASDDAVDVAKGDSSATDISPTNSSSSGQAPTPSVATASTGMSWAAHAASALPTAAPSHVVTSTPNVAAASVPQPATAATATTQASKAPPAGLALKAAATNSTPAATLTPPTTTHPAPAALVSAGDLAIPASAPAPPVPSAFAAAPMEVPAAATVAAASASATPAAATATTPPPPPLQQSKPNPELIVRASNCFSLFLL